MKEQVTLRLYEDASIPTRCHLGRYHPDDLRGWDVSRGDQVSLTEENGGFLFGIVDHVDEAIHEDDEGHRYKLANLWTQD